jgi:hypothetical protein
VITVVEFIRYSAIALMSYQGTWKTDKQKFVGAEYTLGKRTLGPVESDGSGTVSGSFRAPSGFGDAHMVGLVDAKGDVVAAGAVTLSPLATLRDKTEPQGQFFHIHVDGLGVGPYTSDYDVLYDNHLLGDVTAVSTGGVANFTVRAEGAVGKHTIQLISGSVEGQPYLNLAQSPFSFRSNYSFTVNVTKGHPVTVSDPLPRPKPSVGQHLTASIGSGTVGQSFTLTGFRLAPYHSYQLVWDTMAGSRVSGQGYGAEQVPLGEVSTDAFGQFTKKVQVPNELGGPPHNIQLMDGTKVAGSTTFRIMPSVVYVPKTVVAGQPFTIKMLGVGWTDYDNIYTVAYDNSAIGYVCGFNSHGYVKIQLRASETPGIQYVDLYPSIYKGQQKMPSLYCLPLLTYDKDHPGDWLPAFHVVIHVVAKPAAVSGKSSANKA